MEAAQILADLRTAARPDAAPAGLLGPDVFGLRTAPSPPPFLAGVDQSRLRSDQLVEFLARLDMAAPRPPDVGGLSPDVLAGHGDSVLRSDRAPERRSWTRDPSVLPEALRELPEQLELPLLFHDVWLGPGLTDQVDRTHLGELAGTVRGRGRVVLWTNVPRETFERAAQAPPVQGPDPLADVRDIRDWAEGAGVLLVNIDEVFHAGAPMPLNDIYRMELAKHRGMGYAAAADIVRLAVLDRFGGIYADDDNVLRSLWHDLLDEIAETFRDVGFAVQRDGSGVSNSAILMARGHPFARAYLARIAANYERTQAELMGLDKHGTTRAENEMWNWPALRMRRNSVLDRTGPENFRKVSEWAGYPKYTALPALGIFVDLSKQRWVQSTSPLEAQTSFTAEQAPGVIRGVVSTLIRQLHNREGDLHLTYVAPVIAGLPNPPAAWRAVLGFVLGDPSLAGLIRTVTDRLLQPGADGSVVRVVDLPADVRATLRAELGLSDTERDEEPPGQWRMGELMRPATPPAGPRPPRLLTTHDVELVHTWLSTRLRDEVGLEDGDVDRPSLGPAEQAGLVREFVDRMAALVGMATPPVTVEADVDGPVRLVVGGRRIAVPAGRWRFTSLIGAFANALLDSHHLGVDAVPAEMRPERLMRHFIEQDHYLITDGGEPRWVPRLRGGLAGLELEFSALLRWPKNRTPQRDAPISERLIGTDPANLRLDADGIGYQIVELVTPPMLVYDGEESGADAGDTLAATARVDEALSAAQSRSLPLTTVLPEFAPTPTGSRLYATLGEATDPYVQESAGVAVEVSYLLYPELLSEATDLLTIDPMYGRVGSRLRDGMGLGAEIAKEFHGGLPPELTEVEPATTVAGYVTTLYTMGAAGIDMLHPEIDIAKNGMMWASRELLAGSFAHLPVEIQLFLEAMRPTIRNHFTSVLDHADPQHLAQIRGARPEVDVLDRRVPTRSHTVGDLLDSGLVRGARQVTPWDAVHIKTWFSGPDTNDGRLWHAPPSVGEIRFPLVGVANPRPADWIEHHKARHMTLRRLNRLATAPRRVLGGSAPVDLDVVAENLRRQADYVDRGSSAAAAALRVVRRGALALLGGGRADTAGTGGLRHDPTLIDLSLLEPVLADVAPQDRAWLARAAVESLHIRFGSAERAAVKQIDARKVGLADDAVKSVRRWFPNATVVGLDSHGRERALPPLGWVEPGDLFTGAETAPRRVGIAEVVRRLNELAGLRDEWADTPAATRAMVDAKDEMVALAHQIGLPADGQEVQALRDVAYLAGAVFGARRFTERDLVATLQVADAASEALGRRAVVWSELAEVVGRAGGSPGEASLAEVQLLVRAVRDNPGGARSQDDLRALWRPIGPGGEDLVRLAELADAAGGLSKLAALMGIAGAEVDELLLRHAAFGAAAVFGHRFTLDDLLAVGKVMRAARWDVRSSNWASLVSFARTVLDGQLDVEDVVVVRLLAQAVRTDPRLNWSADELRELRWAPTTELFDGASPSEAVRSRIAARLAAVADRAGGLSALIDRVTVAPGSAPTSGPPDAATALALLVDSAEVAARAFGTDAYLDIDLIAARKLLLAPQAESGSRLTGWEEARTLVFDLAGQHPMWSGPRINLAAMLLLHALREFPRDEITLAELRGLRWLPTSDMVPYQAKASVAAASIDVPPEQVLVQIGEWAAGAGGLTALVEWVAGPASASPGSAARRHTIEELQRLGAAAHLTVAALGPGAGLWGLSAMAQLIEASVAPDQSPVRPWQDVQKVFRTLLAEDPRQPPSTVEPRLVALLVRAFADSPRSTTLDEVQRQVSGIDEPATNAARLLGTLRVNELIDRVSRPVGGVAGLMGELGLDPSDESSRGKLVDYVSLASAVYDHAVSVEDLITVRDALAVLQKYPENLVPQRGWLRLELIVARLADESGQPVPAAATKEHVRLLLEATRRARGSDGRVRFDDLRQEWTRLHDHVRRLLGLAPGGPADATHIAAVELLARVARTGANALTVTEPELAALAKRIGVRNQLFRQEKVGGYLHRSSARQRRDLRRLGQIGELALGVLGAHALTDPNRLRTVRRLYDAVLNHRHEVTTESLRAFAAQALGIDAAAVTQAHLVRLLDHVEIAKARHKGVAVSLSHIQEAVANPGSPPAAARPVSDESEHVRTVERLYGLDEGRGHAPSNRKVIAFLDAAATGGTNHAFATQQQLEELANRLGVAGLSELWDLARRTFVWSHEPLTTDPLAALMVQTGRRRPTVEELLAGLRAAVRPEAYESEFGLLGPDIFGLRRARPDSPLAGIDLDAIAPNQLVALVDLLDLTRDEDPTPEQLRPQALRADDSTVWRASRPATATSSAPLGEPREMPQLFFDVWLGGAPLPEGAARGNLQHLRERLPREAAVVLFTDVPRAVIRQAATPPALGPDPLAGVRDMVNWAREHGIRLVNVDQVFHAGAPMDLQEQFQQELAKRRGLGRAAARDILVWELLDRLGGVYVEGNNRFETADGLRELFEESGFAIHSARVASSGVPSPAGNVTVSTSGLMAARHHPYVRRFKDLLKANYQRTQAELLGPDADDDGTVEANTRFLHSDHLQRRYSTAIRTGPGNLIRSGEWAGVPVESLPQLTQFLVDDDRGRWLPSRGLRPEHDFRASEVEEVLQSVVSTLIRELYNRDGDLHLTYVAPVIAGLPDPDAAWRAVIRFILGEPRLASKIRTVTDRALELGPERDGVRHVVAEMVDLPPDVWAELGYAAPHPDDHPLGRWRLAEFTRPYPPRSPTPPTPAPPGPRTEGTATPTRTGTDTPVLAVKPPVETAEAHAGALEGRGESRQAGLDGSQGAADDARWVSPSGPDLKLLVGVGTPGHPSFRPEWAALSVTQTWALLSAELRGTSMHERNRAAFAERIQRFNAEWGTSYPVHDQVRLNEIMDAAHEHLRHLPIARNMDLGRVVTVGDRTMAWVEFLTSQHRFPTYWETGLTTGTPAPAARGYVEEQQGYGAALGRTAGNSRDPIWADHQFHPVSPGEMPIYGALISPAQRGGTYGYGSTVIYFGDHVRGRSTHTPGDSAGRGQLGMVSYTDNAHVFGLLAHADTDLVRFVLAEATGFRFDRAIRHQTAVRGYAALGRYIETQIHGALTWSDVERVVVNWGDLHGNRSRFTTRQQAEAIVAHLREFVARSQQGDRPYTFTVELGEEIGEDDGVNAAEVNRVHTLFSEVADVGPAELELMAELDRLALPAMPFPVRAPRMALVALATRIGIPALDDGDDALDDLWDAAVQARAADPEGTLTLASLRRVLGGSGQGS